MNDNTISKKVIEECDIVDVISSFINVIKRGQNYFAVCPFHDDTRPSLVISRQKKIFKCFVCQESGNAITFVMKYKKIPYRKALLHLLEKYNISYDKSYLNFLEEDDKKEKFIEANKQANDLFKSNLKQKSNIDIINYLNSREIDNNLIDEFSIGLSFKNNMLMKIMTNDNNMFGIERDKKLIWSKPDLIDYSLVGIDDSGEYWDFFINRIMIPIKDEYGNIIAFSGRDLRKDSNIKYLNSKSSNYFQKKSLLFNLDKALKASNETLFLMEGYFDVISAHKSGIKNVVGTMGTSFNIEHVNLLKKNKIKNIILCMDNDSAGKLANYEIGKVLTESNINVYVVKYSEIEEKDINDILVNKGIDKVREVLSNYVTYIEMLIDYKLSKDDFVDRKVINVDFVIDFISKHGNKSLITLYSEKIAEKTGFNLEDIKSNILSSFGFNERLKNIKYFSLSRKENIDYSETKKISKLEKTLLFNMIFNSETVELYLKYINFLNLFLSDKNYKILSNIITIIYKQTYQVDEKIILDQFKKTLENNIFCQEFLKSYELYKEIIRKNNLRSNDIKKQSIDIILYLLNNKKRSILKNNWNDFSFIEKSINKIDEDIYELKGMLNENKTDV